MKKIKMNIKNGRTFEQGCEDYIVDCKARNLRDGTIKHYRDAFKQIFKYLDKNMLIEDMTKEVFADFMLALRENKAVNEMSIYTYSRDLKTVMYFFMEQGWLERYKIKLAKTDKQPIETYTDEDLRKLLKKPNLKQCSFTEYKAWVIVNFLLSTGARQNSLANIKIKDIDFDNKVVYVNITKNRKPLIVPLNDDIIQILKEYLRYRNGERDDYLFCNIFGKKLVRSTLYHSLWQYNKDRGVETTGLHRFRHTFAKKWVLMGGNVVTLSKILGHHSLEITQNYLNILTCDMQDDVEKFNILRTFKNESISMKKKAI